MILLPVSQSGLASAAMLVPSPASTTTPGADLTVPDPAAPETADWVHRTLVVDTGTQRFAAKFAKNPEDDEPMLAHEAEMMGQLGGLAPKPLTGTASFLGPLPNTPAIVSSAKIYFAYAPPDDYFRYITENLVAEFPDATARFEKLCSIANLNSQQLADLVRRGYKHTSLAPLSHHTSSDRRWQWQFKPVGGIENISVNLAYPNLRHSGLADFEHVMPILPWDSAFHVLGRMLTEFFIVLAHAAFVNRMTEPQALAILKSALQVFVEACDVDTRRATETAEYKQWRDYIKYFYDDGNTANDDGISSRKDGGAPTLDNLVEATSRVSRMLSGEPAMQQIFGRYVSISEPSILGVRSIAGNRSGTHYVSLGTQQLSLSSHDGLEEVSIDLGQLRRQANLRHRMHSITLQPVLAPNGYLYIHESINRMLLVADKDGKLVAQFPIHPFRGLPFMASSLEFTPDGRGMVVYEGESESFILYGQDEVGIHSRRLGPVLTEFQSAGRIMSSPVFHPEGGWVYCTDHHTNEIFVCTPTGEIVNKLYWPTRLHGKRIISAPRLTPDGRAIVIAENRPHDNGAADSRLIFFSADGTYATEMDNMGHDEEGLLNISRPVFLADGSLLVLNQNSTLRINPAQHHFWPR